MDSKKNVPSVQQDIFSGHIFLFHAFDMGDDINFNSIQRNNMVPTVPANTSKYFKNYHVPLTVDLEKLSISKQCVSCNLHNFGAITLRYKIPFSATLEDLRAQINDIHDTYQEQSIQDAGTIFNLARSAVKQARFFVTRNTYIVVQVAPRDSIDAVQLKRDHGGTVASLLRFEKDSLSEYKKNEILESGLRYYRGDLLLIDSEAAFIYDDDYEEALDIFEFANVQQCELRYFDRVLDEQLSIIYTEESQPIPFSSYLPFLSASGTDPVTALGKLRVDISVIIERLGNSIKFSDDLYYSELYALLLEKLDLKNWQDSIENKLDIVEDITTIYHNKIEVVRENLLSIAVILLLFIEIFFGVLNLIK